MRLLRSAVCVGLFFLGVLYSAAAAHTYAMPPASTQGSPVPGFITNVFTPTQTVLPGFAATYSIEIQPSNGFSSDVVLSISGLPSGVTATFQPRNTISGGFGYTSVVITVAHSTLAGQYTFTLTSAGGGITQMTQLVLIIQIPTITSVNPPQGTPGDTIQISGTNLGYQVPTIVFTGPNGTQIFSQAAPSPDTIFVGVPRLALTGSIFVLVPDGSGGFNQTNSLSFTRTPGLRIRAEKRDVSAGEEDDFRVVFFGTASPQTVQWSADVGSVDSEGHYTPPGSIDSDQFALVTACLQGTSICDSLRLGLHPFLIAPGAPIIPLGGRLSLDAESGGSRLSPSWSNLSGLGILESDGDFRAPESLDQAGSILLSAELRGIQEQTSVAVTGGFPGLVNRVADYIDFTNVQFQRYTAPSSVVVLHNRAYVLSVQLARNFTGAISYIDVYDVSDKSNPKWLTSAESATDGRLFLSDGALYSVGGSGPSFSNFVMAAYDFQGQTPVLKSWQPLPLYSGWSFAQGTAFIQPQESFSADSPAFVAQYLPTVPSGSQITLQLPPPFSGADYQIVVVGAVRNRLYVIGYNIGGYCPENPGNLVTYDIADNPARLLSRVPLDPTSCSGASLAGERFAVLGQNVFDLSGETPMIIGTFPVALEAFDAQDDKLLVYSNGLRVFRVQAGSLKQTAALFEGAGDAKLVGDCVYSAESTAGLAVYNIPETSGSGGPIPESQVGFGKAYAQYVIGKYLYSAGAGGATGFFSLQDITQNPPSQVALVTTGSAPANDLALVGTALYVGTTSNVVLYDVSTPSQPRLVNTYGVAVNSLCALGNFLYVGTSDGHLIVDNVSNPFAPYIVTVVALPDKPVQMTSTNNLLLIADRTGGLLVFDISNPGSPILQSQLKVARAVVGVQADGNLALLAALEGGLAIVDLTVPAQPNLLSSVPFNTFSPFDSLPTLRNQASSLVLKNKIAFVGTFIYPSDYGVAAFPGTGGTVYGIDYSKPKYPRIVSMSAQAGALSFGVVSMVLVGDDLLTSFNFQGPERENVAYPRNTINFFYPPAALQAKIITPPPLTPGSAQGSPKF